MTTTEAPAYTHTETCDLVALGRATLAWSRNWDTGVLLAAVIETAETYRGRCDCKTLAMSRLETRIRLTRKAGRAANAAGDAVALRRANNALATLLVERNWLRDTP